MTLNTERRDFIRGVGVAAASTAILAGTQALAQSNPQTGAKAMAYQPKPMSFDPIPAGNDSTYRNSESHLSISNHSLPVFASFAYPRWISFASAPFAITVTGNPS